MSSKKHKKSSQVKNDKDNKNIICLNQKNVKNNVEIIPKSINQENYLFALNDNKKPIVFSVGPAGCGKTLIATKWAIKSFINGDFNKIVITRPVVSVENQDIGYLPGDMYNKMLPWTLPIFDVFKEHFSKEYIDQLMNEDKLEIAPMAYIRGRTFKNSVIIVDEAQSTTNDAMKSVLTRLGENSKMIITGDINQSDVGYNNGLNNFIKLYNEKNNNDNSNLEFIYFNKDKDVIRHDAVKEVLNIFGE